MTFTNGGPSPSYADIKHAVERLRILVQGQPYPIIIHHHQKRDGRYLTVADVRESFGYPCPDASFFRNSATAQVLQTPSGPLTVPATGLPSGLAANPLNVSVKPVSTSSSVMKYSRGCGLGSYIVRTLRDFGGTATFSLSFFPGSTDWYDRGPGLVRMNDAEVLELDQVQIDRIIMTMSSADIGNPGIKFIVTGGSVCKGQAAHLNSAPATGKFPGKYPVGFKITPNACECGAAKTMGAAPGGAGHSSWCPVASK